MRPRGHGRNVARHSANVSRFVRLSASEIDAGWGWNGNSAAKVVHFLYTAYRFSAALRMILSTPQASSQNLSSQARIVLRAEDVWKSYDDGAISVLKGVDFEAVEGQTVALCGPSGCGKSTLLHLFGGLDSLDRGRVSVNGLAVNRHRNLLRLLRHEVGFVFQLHNLIPDLTLEENCLIPTVAAGIDHRTAQARLYQLTDRTGLRDRKSTSLNSSHLC